MLLAQGSVPHLALPCDVVNLECSTVEHGCKTVQAWLDENHVTKEEVIGVVGSGTSGIEQNVVQNLALMAWKVRMAG